MRNASQATQATRKALQKKKSYVSKAKAEEAQVKASEPKQPRSPSTVSGNAAKASIVDTWSDDDQVARFVEADT